MNTGDLTKKELTLKECVDRLECLFKAFKDCSEFNYQLTSQNSPFQVLKRYIYFITEAYEHIDDYLKTLGCSKEQYEVYSSAVMKDYDKWLEVNL